MTSGMSKIAKPAAGPAVKLCRKSKHEMNDNNNMRRPEGGVRCRQCYLNGSGAAARNSTVSLADWGTRLVSMSKRLLAIRREIDRLETLASRLRDAAVALQRRYKEEQDAYIAAAHDEDTKVGF